MKPEKKIRDSKDMTEIKNKLRSSYKKEYEKKRHTKLIPQNTTISRKKCN